MGVQDSVETCGRCAMSAVSDLASGDGAGRDPFDGDRIELSAAELGAVSRHVEVLGRLTSRLDRFVFEHTYGR